MYSPKRRFRLFRDLAFTGGGGSSGNITYTYSWIDQSGATATNYLNLEADANFTTILNSRQSDVNGEEGAYISSNDGATWTRKATGITWLVGIYTVDVAIARDDSNIMYIANRGAPGSDYIWRSTNRGESWTALGQAKLWTSVSCSANGSNVVATEITTSNVWVSYDRGSNWTQKSSSPGSGGWISSSMSDDGTFVIVTPQTGSNIQISSNSGSNWSAVTFAPSSRTIYKPLSSSNGQISMVNVLNNPPRISRDYGVTWADVTDVSTGFTYNTLAMSRSGKVIAYATSNSYIFVSQDEGLTWTPQIDTGIRNWRSIAMDGSGSKIIAGLAAGRVWFGSGTPI